MSVYGNVLRLSKPGDKPKGYLTLKGKYYNKSPDFVLSTEYSTKGWDGALYYSTDKLTWTEWDGTSGIQSANGTLYLRGTGNTVISGQSRIYFSTTMLSAGSIECSGNIETLLDWETVVNGQHPVMGNYAFANLFYGCNITSAPELLSVTLSDYCYSSMFQATALTTPPNLPATTLAPHCYDTMFAYTVITKAPIISATTLAVGCCADMFWACDYLETAPVLPATTLAKGCYRYMFRECTSLTKAPALPATTIEGSCYYHMFDGCVSLTTIPALPSTNLPNNCYTSMFASCSSLGLYSSPSQSAQYEYRIPSSGTATTIGSGALNNMFEYTLGDVTTPQANTTYYVATPPVTA